jgi:hypothetical protein
VLAGIGTGPLFWPAAAGLGIGPRSRCSPPSGHWTIGTATSGPPPLVQALAWPGHADHRGLRTGATSTPQPVSQIDKLAANLPGPDQGGFYPREAHSLSEYYNDPHIWKDWFFPVLENRLGPLWPVILGAAPRPPSSW